MTAIELKNFHPESASEMEHKAKLNKQIANFLQKLSSYLVHSNEFNKLTDDARKRFWGELVLTLAESELPHSVWASTSAIRFCRRQFRFFPSANELCDALERFAEPIREAQRKEWEIERLANPKPVRSYNEKISKEANNFLGHYLENERDGFEKLATGRGTNPKEAVRSARSLFKSLYPKDYRIIFELDGSRTA